MPQIVSNVTSYTSIEHRAYQAKEPISKLGLKLSQNECDRVAKLIIFKIVQNHSTSFQKYIF